jgi:transcriptional regulator with PAS, ATPase and Fis domain
LPPLRNRRADIAELANFFLKKYAEKYNKPSLSIAETALQKLETYAWPGNVRNYNMPLKRL